MFRYRMAETGGIVEIGGKRGEEKWIVKNEDEYCARKMGKRCG